ncbi:MAG: putative porin [Prevotellaceae bacterium]|jgi:hypothetical protein|nr:putative porin [Prevotellaceae bacterium]
MKKIIFFTLIGVLPCCLSAQPRSIGLRLGGNQELSYQHYVGGNEVNIIQIDMGSFYFQGLQATVTYNWMSNGNSPFSTYGGFGVGLGFNWGNNDWYPRFWEKEDPDYAFKYANRDCARRYFFMGVAGQIGIEYKFNTTPVILSLDYRPLIGFDLGKKGIIENDAVKVDPQKRMKINFHTPGLWDFGLAVKYLF